MKSFSNWLARLSTWALATTLAGALVACGGGGGGGGSSVDVGTSGPPPATPPANSGSLIIGQSIMDFAQRGVAYVPKGNTIIGTDTGFSVTRVADKSELVGDYAGATSSISAIVYSRYTPTNVTGEYVLVHGGNSTSAWIYRVSDNRMMTVLRFKPSLPGTQSRVLGEVNELRWHYGTDHPYRLYFVGNNIDQTQRVGTENVAMSFYYVDFDPATGTQGTPVLIRDFSADFPGITGGMIMNDVEGDSSIDSRYWAWQVMTVPSTGSYRTNAIFTYDMQANQVLGSVQRDCTGAVVPCTVINTPATAAPYITRPNMVEMSPLGTRVLVDFERAYTGNNAANIGTVADGPKAFLPDFSDPIRVGADATHSGWAWDANGNELFVSQNSRNDWVEAVDIRNATTANCVLISGNDYGCGTKVLSIASLVSTAAVNMHFGKFYDRANKRGWVYMSTYDGDYAAWYKNQELLVQVRDATLPAGPRIVRLGPTYNTAFDYRSEGSGALDFAGTSIWATANWGFNDGRGDAIRIQLPANLFTVLNTP